jgi:transcriptional regulator with XRE-family HTH domain
VVVDQTALARHIGGRIREARLAAGLTQQQLAQPRYTKAYVSALENGLSKPSMAALTFFSERLGLPTSRFIGDEAKTWTRLEADLVLAAGRWTAAVDAYQALLGEAPNAAQRPELLLGLAEALAGLDRGAEVAAAAGEAAHLFSASGRETHAALARYWLSCGEYQQGNTADATAILGSVLEQVRAGLRVEPDFEVRLLMALASNAARDGSHQIALAYLEEVRGLADKLDNRRRAVFLFNLAYSYRETGDYEAAIRAGIASHALFRATEMESETAGLENSLALSYLALENTEKAEQLAASSRARFERLGDDRWLAHVLDTQARIALARGAHDDALRLGHEALNRAEQTSNENAAIDAQLTIARTEVAMQKTPDALEWYERAAASARRLAAPQARVREVLGEWAELLANAGEHQKAFEMMREALKSG